MQARRKTRLYIVLAVLAGLGLTVSLTLYALSSNIDLFYTPGEIIYGKTETRALPHTGQRLRVGVLHFIIWWSCYSYTYYCSLPLLSQLPLHILPEQVLP